MENSYICLLGQGDFSEEVVFHLGLEKWARISLSQKKARKQVLSREIHEIFNNFEQSGGRKEGAKLLMPIKD